jgi:hypothetical protein
MYRHTPSNIAPFSWILIEADDRILATNGFATP